MSSQLGNLSSMKAVTEMRSAIDGFAARYAAMRVGDGADTKPLLDAFRRFRKTAQSGDYQVVAEADRSLHLAIISLADVPSLAEVWTTIARELEVFRVETIRLCWPDLNVLFEGHRPIVDAICAGNQPLAEDTSRAHLDAVWYRLAEHKHDSSLPNTPLARASTYLAFNLQENVRLSFLARHIARTSAGHLARLFQEHYGISFTVYLRQLRLQKAVELLTRSTLPIARIANCVGYRDCSRFAQHFHQRFGLTPRQYRKQFVQAVPTQR